MNAEGNCPGGDEQPDVRWFTLRKERRTSTSMRKRDRRKAMTATHFRISETFFQYDQFTHQILSTAALNKEGNALRAGTTAGDKTGVVSEPQRPVFQRRRLILSK